MTVAARNVLSVYRQLLRLAQAMPVDKRGKTLARIRAEFRDSRGVSDQKECVRNTYNTTK